jgi:hypothetical protein
VHLVDLYTYRLRGTYLIETNTEYTTVIDSDRKHKSYGQIERTTYATEDYQLYLL